MFSSSTAYIVLGYGAKRIFRNCILALSVCAATLGAAHAEPVTVVALGDSLTAGYGLPQGDGLVPQLQAWLQAKGADVVVENAGVSGDTTAGGLARTDWALTRDADAMIVTLGGNDLLRGIDPANSRANLDAILAKAKARGLPVLLIGLTAPGNYGPEYKTAFDAIYPDLATKYGTLLDTNFFRGIASDDPAAVRALMQDDGIHPNAVGVAKIVANIGPQVMDLVGQVNP